MRIQESGNYNINHKAYFKNNALFREAYGNFAKPEKTIIEKFKNNLPNHELEILKLDKERFHWNISIFNNITKKFQIFNISRYPNGTNRSEDTTCLDRLMQNLIEIPDFFEKKQDEIKSFTDLTSSL